MFLFLIYPRVYIPITVMRPVSREKDPVPGVIHGPGPLDWESLKFETVKYGQESCGTRMTALARQLLCYELSVDSLSPGFIDY
jgi:hypothetical protein